MSRSGPRTEPAGEVWSALARPEAFPDDASARDGVEWLQTHLSHVYLTATRVYKFRKPVSLGFVDFSTPAEREADCLREVALNRRLAPDVYLGVAPLEGTDGEPRVGAAREAPDPEASEHCVVMRRLADGRDALSLLESGALDAAKLDALAVRLAPFHAEHSLGRPAPFTPEAWRERCTRPVVENFELLAESPSEVVPEALLREAREPALHFAAEHAERFEARRLEGRAVDAHGDLHLQHVWYERDADAPVVIDCLEFSERLRQIDVAAEVAFLAMDLRYRGERGLAERFLRSYARETDDFDLYSVVDYFIAYRAAVRAKVAALAAADGGISAEQREGARASAGRHLRLAAEALATRGDPVLVVICGSVGTGKSSVAAELADRLDAVVVASDRVRKHLHGVSPTTRLAAEGWGQGAYSAEQKERVYEALLERARPALDSGRPVIVDATFSRRAQREAAARCARDCAAPVFAVEVRCAPEVAHARLVERARRDRDPSDAGPEAIVPSARAFEPLDEWPEASRARVHTDRDDWRAAVRGISERVRGLARAAAGASAR